MCVCECDVRVCVRESVCMCVSLMMQKEESKADPGWWGLSPASSFTEGSWTSHFTSHLSFLSSPEWQYHTYITELFKMTHAHGNFLVVQWSGLLTFTAKSAGCMVWPKIFS